MHFVPVDRTSKEDVAREFLVESKTIAVLAESPVFDGVFPISAVSASHTEKTPAYIYLPCRCRWNGNVHHLVLIVHEKND